MELPTNRFEKPFGNIFDYGATRVLFHPPEDTQLDLADFAFSARRKRFEDGNAYFDRAGSVFQNELQDLLLSTNDLTKIRRSIKYSQILIDLKIIIIIILDYIK